MGTCMMFPGLNGLMRKQDRFRYPEFQPTREKMEYSSGKDLHCCVANFS